MVGLITINNWMDRKNIPVTASMKKNNKGPHSIKGGVFVFSVKDTSVFVEVPKNQVDNELYITWIRRAYELAKTTGWDDGLDGRGLMKGLPANK